MGRHPADFARLVLAAGVVIACLFAARAPGVNPVETAIYAELQRVPTAPDRYLNVLTWAGWWPGIVLAAGLAGYLGRARMALALAWSGGIAWGLTVIVHVLIGPRVVSAEVLQAATHGIAAGTFDFPSTHAAVAAALATAAGPYLSRTLRGGCWVLVVLVAVADVVLGYNLPLGVFGGGFLGWGTGTLLHLVLGAPGRGTSDQAVELALRQAGLDTASITPRRRRFLDPLQYDVVDSAGQRLQMKVVRRLHRLAGPGYKARRMLASVETEHVARLSTPRHEVEHEAYVTLLAERAGVGTVPVLLAGEIEHGPPFLIRRWIEGRTLASMDPLEVDDALLGRLWKDVAALGAVRIAHHDLRAENILVDDSGRPRIMDFTFSRVGGPSGQTAQDAAELLVSVASVVGIERAVASAAQALPPDTLREALPHLQTLALHHRFRRQFAREVSLSALREALADTLGCPVPSFRSPVRATTLALLIAGGLAVYLLLPELSSIGEVKAAIQRADWGWLLVAFATGMGAVVISSMTILGACTEPLPVGKTVAVQVAAAFTGRTTAGALGFYGINMSFLERQGLRRAHAVGVLVLNRVATVVVAVLFTVIGIAVIGNAVPVSFNIGWQWWVGAAGVLAVLAGVLTSAFGRARLVRPAIRIGREMWAAMLPALRNRWRFTQLLIGEVGFMLLSAAGLATTLAAFQPRFPVLAVMAVFVVGSTLGQLLPTPGGLGAVEGALIAGLTAVGIQPADAIAAALTARVLTFWLPVLPGVIAFRVLQHRGVV
jgi:undecaprenyl-diphosphatase